jgi:hypothetical protein
MKRCYASLEEAAAIAAPDAKKHAYECSRGHFHVGTKRAR